MRFFLRAGAAVTLLVSASSVGSVPSEPTVASQQTSAASSPQTSVADSAVSWKCSQSGPWSVTFAGDGIVWTNYSAGTVMKAPLDGGAAIAIATKQSGPCAIATDGTNLYWTNSTNGTVIKMPLTGRIPIVLAGNQREPSAIAVGPTTVTWMTADGSKMASLKTGESVEKASDQGNAGGGTNPGTVKCNTCPVYCRRYVPQIPNGYWESYICGWKSCPPCGA